MLLLAWLWYQEFVKEAATFAAHGVSDLHKDTAAEIFTMGFLALIPVLLCLGWWWTRRVLAPLRALTRAAQQVESNNLRLSVPRTMNDDEVDALAAVFASMTARLDSSFQQIREFTLHASHELKTPLTVMRAQLETVLRESGSLPAEQTEWIESLLDEVQRLAKIVDSLTLLTKADAGLVTLERQPVPFGELVQEAFEDALILAQPQRVHVTLDTCENAPLIGDRHRLRQLLLILVDNAVKYTRPDGEIHIALREHDGAGELRITNDGGGITPETQRRLFGRFVRGENAIGKVEGCGLGLTIAQWIAQAHGGSIELRSEAGEKTTVLVRLPLAQTTPSVVADKLTAV
ncbi:MAG: HAMP domain-containing histidine kinase [Planctomycetes bacterium]|nr:HAMP domain-containing histidine kinase [Planctomycetota bacterium]